MFKNYIYIIAYIHIYLYIYMCKTHKTVKKWLPLGKVLLWGNKEERLTFYSMLVFLVKFVSWNCSHMLFCKTYIYTSEYSCKTKYSSDPFNLFKYRQCPLKSCEHGFPVWQYGLSVLFLTKAPADPGAPTNLRHLISCH